MQFQPCQPPANEFDTSDYLCLPGRNRKLNIFNTCLSKLLDSEDRESGADVDEGLKENDINYRQQLAETIEHANRVEIPEKSEVAAQKSSKRMTMARKSIIPKSIAVDVIQEEEEEEDQQREDSGAVVRAWTFWMR